MMIKTLICFALSLVLWLPSWIKGPTTNAQDVKASGLDWSAGADEVVVEIPAQSGRTLQLAAGELVRYFRKMTQDRLDISISRSALQTQGAALRVVSRRRKAADPAKETGIAVGGASDPDAYAIRVADGVLHIDGVSERAALYGVYDWNMSPPKRRGMSIGTISMPAKAGSTWEPQLLRSSCPSWGRRSTSPRMNQPR